MKKRGFKNSSKKKKSKSKNKSKDNEWAFDGGVSSTIASTTTTQSDGEHKFHRRTTQERDERLRRSRLKHQHLRQSKDFAQKMAKRIKFTDVISHDEDLESSRSDDEAEMDSFKDSKPLRPQSSLSVTDRIQRFVNKSLIRHKPADKDKAHGRFSGVDSGESQSDDSDNEHDSASIDEEEEGDEIEIDEDDNSDAMGHTAGTFNGINVEEFDANDSDVEKPMDEDLADDKEALGSVGDFFDWFYQSNVVLEKKAKARKPQLLADKIKIKGSVEEYSLYCTSSCLAENSPPVLNDLQIKSIRDIPGVFKMFRNQKSFASKQGSFNEFSSFIFPYLIQYKDIFLEGRDHLTDSVLLEGPLVHSVAHVVRSRAKVVRHNQKLKEKSRKQALDSLDSVDNTTNSKKKSKKKNKGTDSDMQTQQTERTQHTELQTRALDSLTAADNDAEESSMRDQGFCRPRLLILCPIRNTAKSILKTILSILGENTSVSGMEKFEMEFADPDGDEDEEGDDDFPVNPNKKPNKRREITKKPDDWEALFHGNMDDDFKLGIQVNPGHGRGSGAEKGAYVRLFSDFYISDIILASPIGLKLVMEKTPGKLDADFLSSIEQVVLHQADVLSMQNWDHVDFILRHTNKLPKESHDTDFSRVRNYFLDGQGALHRQLMIISSFNSPELQAFYREFASSASGALRLKKHWGEGVLSKVALPVKQIFQRISPASSLIEESLEQLEERRFQYFKSFIFDQILKSNQSRTLIVTPSYFHYVRIRNELMAKDANAVYVCEYSRESEISRGRSRFFQGLKDIMVYSGRAHFFRRFRIRGARHVVFYSLPEYPHFYSEIVNMLSAAVEGEQGESAGPRSDLQEELSCVTLFTKYEKMPLERIIGSKRAEHMLASDKPTFLFF